MLVFDGAAGSRFWRSSALTRLPVSVRGLLNGIAVRPNEQPHAIGDLVDRKYVLREQIGAGGMGCVYLASQPALDRLVALKIMHSRFVDSAVHVATFRSEAIMASRVRDPRIVSVIDIGTLDDGAPFIVMEHVAGRPLSRVFHEEMVPLRRGLELLIRALSALDVTHQAGVVHGDVKGENLLVDAGPSEDRVILIDFGLARVLGECVPVPPDRMVAGTPEYMAPEVLCGRGTSVASDVYAVGVLLYELLTGGPPFTGRSSAEIARRQVHDVVIQPSTRRPDRGVSRSLDHIVLKALAKRPEDRFVDAKELIRALRDEQQRLSRAPASSAWLPERIAEAHAATSVCAPRSRRLARGSQGQFGPSGTGLDGLRHSVGDALVGGDVAQVVGAYRALAAALTDLRLFDAAARELREGIDVLDGAASTAQHRRMLEVELAALFERIGDSFCARELAADLDLHATL